MDASGHPPSLLHRPALISVLPAGARVYMTRLQYSPLSLRLMAILPLTCRGIHHGLTPRLPYRFVCGLILQPT